ncbi:MAG: oligosaccharide flippase family protein [Firmicutes bacterium]|nr:oligosaccharide flippase family protein [Bacillota bacterium]MCL5064682.1 oligosaccharide flippase family protein [Bacillota bacterium]
MTKNRRSLWWGTLTLTGAAITSRGLGMVYRVLLARFLGAEGLGLYQMIFPLFIALVTLSVAGTPVAISQMVADDQVDPLPLLQRARMIVLSITIPVMIIIVFAARPIVLQLYHDPRFVPLLLILTPALLAIAFSSVLRGFFLGQQMMTVPSLAQVVEQIVRVIFLVVLLHFAADHLIQNRIAIATALIPIGEGISLLILAIGFYQWQRPARTLPETPSRPASTPAPTVVSHRAILRMSLPIMFSRLLGSLIGVIEAALIPRQLRRHGFSEIRAVAYFGKVTGMALPLILFPTALTVALSTNLIPAVAKAHARHDRQAIAGLIQESLSATAYLTVPVTAILLILGTALDDWVFHGNLQPTVFIPLTLGAFFLYFDIALAGILRGLGRTDIPLHNDLISTGAEVAMILAFASPEGLAAAIAVGFISSWWLNLRATARLTGIHLPWLKILMKPGLATVPMVLAVPLWERWASLHHLARSVELTAGLAIAAVIYLMALRLTGVQWSRLL